MKRFLFLMITLAGLVPFGSQAQQVPLFSQYYYNPFLYNPAMAGQFGQGAAFLIHRSQWNAIEGSPLTNAFTIDGPIKSEKVGLGFAAYTDETDIFERVGANLAYSYRLQFNDHASLGLGLGLGMLNHRIDFSKVIVKDLDDQVLMSNQYQRRMAFDGSFGAHLRIKAFELGVAVPNLLAPEVKYYDINNNFMYYSVARHFRGLAKYTILLTQDTIKLEPLVYAQYAPGAPLQLDGGLRLNYRDRAWLGALYRHNFAISISAGIKVHKRVVLGYAYDVVTSDIAPYAGGTHEVMLGFTFGKDMGREEKLIQDMKDLQLRLEREESNVDSLARKVEDSDKKIEDVEQDMRNLEHDHKKLEEEYREMEQKLKNFSDVFGDDDPANMSDSARKAMGNGLKKGDAIMLDNLYFGNENAELLPSSYRQLNQLAEYLAKHPEVKIEVAGHSDQSGSAAYNLKLSQDRANAVKYYLIQQGAKKDQIKAVGYGQSKPIANNKTYEGRKRNRRVELIILEK